MPMLVLLDLLICNPELIYLQNKYDSRVVTGILAYWLVS